ncbi:MAG: DUF547 domain-containing protein [Leptospiraceae bacterium]|nr:DUF547 domain-containing protein [Leptospiraceae bacterium]
MNLTKSILFIMLMATPVFGFDHSHKTFDSILKKYVSNGRVDYKSLKSDSSLKIYLDSASSVTKAEYNSYSKEQKLSFLINAYNAFTIQLILDNYPIKSIRKIGILPLAAWKKDFFKLLGEERSLGWIEHEKLRKDFDEPRIHFAIVCASIGCPPLINEAYVPEKLEIQLQTVMTQFVNDNTKNRYDLESNTLYISPIFDWFQEDFSKKGSLVDFIQVSMKSKIGIDPKIKYTNYDWNLNEK